MDEYIRKEDVTKMCGDWYVEQGEEEGFIGTVNQMLGMFPPADVVSVSAYKQVMLDRDVAVEQLKQIGKGLGEAMDDVVLVAHGWRQK